MNNKKEIKRIKYGIKLWSINSELYGEFIELYKKGKADYLEILYVPNKEEGIDILIKNNIPVVVHAPTYNQNILFAKGNTKENKDIIQKTLDFSKKLKAKVIIVHPDVGNKEKFIEFLKAYKHENLIIENMPKLSLNGKDCLGYNIKELKEFISTGDFGLCFDFSHAIKSAISQKKDYKKQLKELIKLNPSIAHISDGTFKNENDEHLNLGEGDFDLKFIIKLIKKSSIKNITFEVPKTRGLQNDIKNIEYFKSISNKII